MKFVDFLLEARECLLEFPLLLLQNCLIQIPLLELEKLLPALVHLLLLLDVQQLLVVLLQLKGLQEELFLLQLFLDLGKTEVGLLELLGMALFDLDHFDAILLHFLQLAQNFVDLDFDGVDVHLHPLGGGVDLPGGRKRVWVLLPPRSDELVEVFNLAEF